MLTFLLIVVYEGVVSIKQIILIYCKAFVLYWNYNFLKILWVSMNTYEYYTAASNPPQNIFLSKFKLFTSTLSTEQKLFAPFQ